jgi:CRISPR/Cas system-associated protein endoribonuclease Cas2
MGSVWSRLGAKRTVIEYEDHILPNMDKKVSKNFQKILIKQGFDFKLSTSFNKVIKNNDKISVLIENKGQTLERDCDKILVSMGSCRFKLIRHRFFENEFRNKIAAPHSVTFEKDAEPGAERRRLGHSIYTLLCT